ncbi:winged helix-turn-helix domain-containing protein [Ensifer sp. IC4062]|nr:winged helix-turn-helix domain-containing tetratricopeptide repeat protein [Ensifer sp. IC4062]MCA1439963.1 winged helix-turn-helix domain-containing protein [Ensifer sp. IC4062]
MDEQRYAFGRFVLDPGSGVLRRDGQPVALGQRGIALLKTLLEAHNQPVEKGALIDAGWPGLTVEESNLSVQIAHLRKALGQREDGQDWIVTVPRRGYRLLKASGFRPEAEIFPSLAVLPFANLSGDPEQQYFADGVVEDIITALSRFKSFAVIARNTSFVYRDAGDSRKISEELGVRYVLEGSLRKWGKRLRISAQLVDAVANVPLWAQNFDGDLEDVFEFQDRIAESVVISIEPQVQKAELARSRRERPESISVYDIYLRILPKILAETADQNAEAHALLTGALAQEPENPLILALSSYVIEHRRTMGWPPFGPDDTPRCIELARRGIERANGDALVLAMCGITLIIVARDYSWGLAVIQAAVDTNPHNLAVVVRAGVANLYCGNLDAALDYFMRARRLSPLDPHAHMTFCGLADIEMIRGNYEQSLLWASKSLALNPNFDPTLWLLIANNAHLGRIDEARRYLQHLLLIAPDSTIASIANGQTAKVNDRLRIIVDGLRLAGLPEA